MIGKQTKGTSFGGCVCYVLKEEKSKLLEAVGVDGIPEQMAEQFELQALLNDKVKNIVGHTSLNFSPEDGNRLKHDDVLMLQIAHDYMKLMGIENTQFIIARHIDREHPHCHIIFNRVNNDGKTISDKNDFRRNEKTCKMLTAKYRLHFANGKDHIKEERLRPYDRAKHEIYKALKEELPKAQNWRDLKEALADRDIDMRFKVSRTTREIQGVKFEYSGFSFSGSKISREFSYMNIDNRLEENTCASLLESAKQEPKQQKEEALQSVSHSDDNLGFNLGLLNGSSSYDATAAEEADFNLYLCEKFGYRDSCSVMKNANGICVSVSERELDLYIRFWEYSEGVGNFPDWSIIIVRSNFKKNQEKNLKDLARFFKEYTPRYGYKFFCTESDDYKYYQTLGLKLIHKDLLGQDNYGLAMKDLNV